MALSPTVNLLELCKKALTKWKEQKARCPERSHPGVSRARKAAARNVPAHHNDHRDADTFSVLPESAPTPEELALLAALIAEDEDGPRLDLPDAVSFSPSKELLKVVVTVMWIEYLKCLERRCEGKHRKG